MAIAVENSVSFLTLLVFLVPIVVVLYLNLKNKLSKASNLPPGPTPWPIIGNLAHIIGNDMPHVALANIAKSYGPLISVRLGSQLVVVGSSPTAAAEILKTHDQQLSGRMVPHVSFAKDPELNKESIAWTFECDERWKFFRTLMKNEIYSSKIVDGQRQAEIREKKVQEMSTFLASKQGERVKIREVAFTYTFNVLANIYMSQDLIIGFEGGDSERVSWLVREMMELYTSVNISDLYPALGGLDLQGLHRKTNKCVDRIRETWDSIIRTRRSQDKLNNNNNNNNNNNISNNGGGGGDRRDDFLDVLLAAGFSDEQISFIFEELLAAVSDSTSSTIEWALSELIKRPETMQRLKDELNTFLGGQKNENDGFMIIRESDIANLPYLHACVKETLRLHPPAPLLLPHRATKDVQVMKYTIPKDTQVFVNVWTIARDPSIWEDPLSYKPERFIVADLDYKGNNFEYLPFGGGRRICAGLPLAIRKVQMAVAALVHHFDWSLPDDGTSPPNELDMSERYGITLMKQQPLELIPKLNASYK